LSKVICEKLDEVFVTETNKTESIGNNVIELFPEVVEPKYEILDVKSFMGLNVQNGLVYLNPIIRREGIVMITGSAGVGKTMFVLGLCKSLLTGESFGSWTVENQCNVLYIDGELPIYEMKGRITLFGLQGTEGFHIFSSMVNKDMNFNLTNVDFQNHIIQKIEEDNIQVCVFDNLSSLTPGIDENSKSSYDPINQYFLTLRKKGVTTIFLHHTTKGKKEQRGTSGRTDNIDVWCNIERTSEMRSRILKLKLKFNKFRYEESENLHNNVFVLNGSTWTHDGQETTLSENKIKLLKLLDEGKTQTEIGRLLNVKQSYVSRMKTELIKKGYLDSRSKLTEEGRRITGGV